MPRIAGAITQLCGAGCVLVGTVAFALLLDQMDGAYLGILAAWVGAGMMALVCGGLASRPSPANLVISAALDASFCGVLLAVASRLPLWLRLLSADDAAQASTVVTGLGVASGVAMLTSLVATPLALRYWRAHEAGASRSMPMPAAHLAAGSLVGPAAAQLSGPGSGQAHRYEQGPLTPDSTAPGFPPPVTGAFPLGPADSGEIVLPVGGVAAAKAARGAAAPDAPQASAASPYAPQHAPVSPYAPQPPQASPYAPQPPQASPYAPQPPQASPYAPQPPQASPFAATVQPFAGGPPPGQPAAGPHAGPPFQLAPRLSPQPPLRRDLTPSPLLPPTFGGPADHTPPPHYAGYPAPGGQDHTPPPSAHPRWDQPADHTPAPFFAGPPVGYQEEPRHAHASSPPPFGPHAGPPAPPLAVAPPFVAFGQPSAGLPPFAQPVGQGPAPSPFAAPPAGLPPFAQPVGQSPAFVAFGQPSAGLPAFAQPVGQAPPPAGPFGPHAGQPPFGPHAGQPPFGPHAGQPGFRHDATPPLHRALGAGGPDEQPAPRSRAGLWLLGAGAVIGGLIVVIAVLSGDEPASATGASRAPASGASATPPTSQGRGAEAKAAGAAAGTPAETPTDAPGRAAAPPTSPSELLDALHAAVAGVDTAAIEALAVPTAFGFGVRATSISRTAAELAAAFAADLGTPPAGGFTVTASGLELGEEGNHAWIAEELDVAASPDSIDRRRFAITLLATAKGGTWKIVAWHWAVRLPDETVETLVEAGDLPIPEGFDDRLDAPPEAVEAFRAAFSSVESYALAVSPRVTAFNFGSAPGERLKGGDTIRRVFRKLRADIRIREGVIVTAAGSWDPLAAAAPDVAWAAANVEFATKKSRRILRVLAVMVRENDEWRIVQTQWSDGA